MTPGWWGAPENTWYLNLSVFNTPDTEGLMGATAPGSWLPALLERHVARTDAGRIASTLRGPPPDVRQRLARDQCDEPLRLRIRGRRPRPLPSRAWPPENPPCVLPNRTPPKPLAASVAAKLCSTIVDKVRHANCVFDATFTGEPGFAKTYLVSQRIEAGSTTDQGGRQQGSHAVRRSGDVHRHQWR